MTAFDRQQIIEAAARTIHDDACLYYHHRDEEPPGCHIDIARKEAAIALPVIVAAVLKPIRELHREQFQFCRECDADYPCLTVRLLDQIEADLAGGATLPGDQIEADSKGGE